MVAAAAKQAFQGALVTSLGPKIETPPKHNLQGRRTLQSLAKQLQTCQELTNNSTTQRQKD
jgi:hypothetical protein